jgi:dihydrofolate reductase
VHKLKENAEQDIWLVGGSQLIKAFFTENLVQDLIIFIVPLILGSGIPLFDRIGTQIKLRTSGIQKYENGLVRVDYEVPG